jgi:hypothetical protein
MLKKAKQIAKKKLKKKLRLLLYPLLFKALLILLILVIIQGSAAYLKDMFNGWIQDKDISMFETGSDAIEQWLKDQEGEISLDGTIYDKQSLNTFLNIEKGTYYPDIQTTMKEVHGPYSGRGAPGHKIKYTLKIKDASYGYRLPWQLVTMLCSINDYTKQIDEKHPFLEKIEELFRTRYYGLLEHGKEVSLSDENLSSLYCDDFKYQKTHKRIVIDDGVKEQTVKVYPLPYFSKIETFLTTYEFKYEMRKTKEKKTISYYYKTEHYTDSHGNKKTKKRKVTKIVKIRVFEPVLVNIETTDHIDEFINKLKEVGIQANDIQFILEIIAMLPYGEGVSQDLYREEFGFSTLDYGFLPNFDGQNTYPTFDYPTLNGSERDNVITAAKSLLGLHYFWGGKYPKQGMNSNWGKLAKVTAAGSRFTEKYIPLGLDCSGFVDWAYVQATGKTVGRGGGTVSQWRNTMPVSSKNLMPGDLGFYHSGGGKHVGIFIGKDSDGNLMFIHCGGSSWGDKAHYSGQVTISKNYKSYNGYPPVKFKYFRRVIN